MVLNTQKCAVLTALLQLTQVVTTQGFVRFHHSLFQCIFLEHFQLWRAEYVKQHIFLEFFLWLCLLIKAHGNNMSCDVVKRGRSCYFHEWNLHIWNYLFLPLFFNMFVWIDIYFICVDIFGYCVHRTAWSFAPGQKGDSCMQVIKQVHLNRMNGLETFQTHH